VSNSITHWALLGCASSYVALCIELHYTINFVTLRCDLCCIMLHFVLYCTTLHSNSTTLHYVRFLLCCELCYIALCCVISSTALWTLLWLCCIPLGYDFVMLHCELYYVVLLRILLRCVLLFVVSSTMYQAPLILALITCTHKKNN